MPPFSVSRKTYAHTCNTLFQEEECIGIDGTVASQVPGESFLLTSPCFVAFNVAAYCCDDPLNPLVEEGTGPSHLLRSNDLFPLVIDPLFQHAQVASTFAVTQSMVQTIPCTEVQGITVRGVHWLVMFPQQHSPHLIHQSRHCSLRGMGCVSWCPIHEKEAVGHLSATKKIRTSLG